MLTWIAHLQVGPGGCLVEAVQFEFLDVEQEERARVRHDLAALHQVVLVQPDAVLVQRERLRRGRDDLGKGGRNSVRKLIEHDLQTSFLTTFFGEIVLEGTLKTGFGS